MICTECKKQVAVSESCYYDLYKILCGECNRLELQKNIINSKWEASGIYLTIPFPIKCHPKDEIY
jgi:hypothetical protein